MTSTGIGALWQTQQDTFDLKIRHRWPFDITSATTQEIRIKQPDGTVITKTTTFTPGDAQAHEATLSLSDLSQAGTHLAQSYIVSPSFTGYSRPYEGFVGSNL